MIRARSRCLGVDQNNICERNKKLSISSDDGIDSSSVGLWHDKNDARLAKGERLRAIRPTREGSLLAVSDPGDARSGSTPSTPLEIHGDRLPARRSIRLSRRLDCQGLSKGCHYFFELDALRLTQAPCAKISVVFGEKWRTHRRSTDDRGGHLFAHLNQSHCFSIGDRSCQALKE